MRRMSWIAAVVLGALCGGARADGVAVDGALVFGLPAALGTGLTSGVGAGVTVAGSGGLGWGARAAWSSASEFGAAWSARHDDVRVRLDGVAQRAVGRGVLALRFGLGTTLVVEERTRNQGARAGLLGDALSATAVRALPALDVEVSITLAIAGAWSMVVRGGPEYHLDDGAVQVGWLAALGASWRR